MRLPLRAIHPVAHVTRAATLDYVQHTLDAPIFSLTEVPDLIGLPCAVDITINDGFYITILLYIAARTVLRAAVRHVLERRR